MATISSPSSVLMPVRTPLWVSVVPDLNDSDGHIAQWFVVFTGGSVDGNQVVITYGTRSVTLTCVTGMMESEVAPDQWLGAATASISAMNFANAAKRNYWLNRDYVITRLGVYVYFNQRPLPVSSSDTNTSFSLLSFTPTPSTGMATTGSPWTGVNPVKISNHSLRVAVYMETTPGAYERLPVEMSCGIVKGITPAVDIAGLVRPHVLPDLPAYDTPFAELVGVTAPHGRRMYVEAVEFSGSPAVPRKVEQIGTPTAPLTAWLAGFQQEDADKALEFVGNLSYTTNKRYWLTWRGRTDRVNVSRGQRHYLTHYNWYQLSGADMLQLQVRIGCADGSVVDWTTRYNQPAADYVRRRLSIWATGYDHLALDELVPTGTSAAWYSVRLKASSSGAILSEEKSFILVPENYQELHVLFLNSLGGYDTIRSTGSWEESEQHAQQETTRPPLPTDYGDRLAVRGASTPLGGQRKLMLSTGYLPLSEHRCVVDVLNSPDVRLVDHVHQSYRKMRIVKSAELPLEGRGGDENLYALKLELMMGDKEEVVTRPFPPYPPLPPVIPPAPIELGGG